MEIKETHLYEYARHIWKTRKVVVLISVVLVMACICIYIRNLPNLYNAKIKMFAHTGRGNVITGGSTGGGLPEMERMMFIANQQDLVFSYPLYEKLKNSLHVKYPSWFAEVTNVSRRPSLGRELNKFLWGETYVSGMERADIGYLSFRSSVSFEPQSNAGTFNIGYQDRDPNRALLMTKEISNALIELNHDLVNIKKNNLTKYLEEKITEARARFQASRKRMEVFLVENHLFDDPNLMKVIYSRYLESMDQLQREIIGSETGVTFSGGGSVPIALPDVLKDGDQNVTFLLSEINRLQQASTQDDTGHPEVGKVIMNRLGELRKALEASIEQKYKAASSSKIRAAKKLRRLYEAQMAELPSLQSRLTDFMSETNENGRALSILTESYLRTLVQGDSELTQLFAMEEPMMTDRSFKTDKSRLFLSLSLAGAFLVIVALAVFHFSVQTIFTKHDLQLVELPEHTHLGSIPFQLIKRRASVMGVFLRHEGMLKIAQTIKSKLLTDRINNHAKIIHVTSEGVGVGKSTTTLALALALKHIGMRVLALDCDHRASDFNLFDYSVSPDGKGPLMKFRSLLDVNGAIEKIPSATLRERILVTKLVAPGISDEAMYAYYQNNFRAELDPLRKNFDIIVMDAPPMFFSDTAVLAGVADAVVFCLPEGEIRGARVAESIKSLQVHMGESARLMTVITKSKLATNTHDIEESYRNQYSRGRNRMAA